MEDASRNADAALTAFLEAYDSVCELQEALAQHMSNVRTAGRSGGRERKKRERERERGRGCRHGTSFFFVSSSLVLSLPLSHTYIG